MKSKSGIIVAGALIVFVLFAFIANQNKQTQSPGSLTESLRTTPEPENLETTTSPTGLPQSNPTTAVAQMTLAITSHKDGDTVSNSSVVIRGRTKPFAEVFVNDAETDADASGNFSVTLTIDEGENPIVVSANDRDGNVAETEFMLYYNSE